jgi:hypothetical protein
MRDLLPESIRSPLGCGEDDGGLSVETMGGAMTLIASGIDPSIWS